MHQSTLHFIHKVYTYFDSTSMSPQNNESDRSWSSCSSTSSILLQLELGYLSGTAEIQDIAEALSSPQLFSSQVLLYLQNYLPLSKLQPPLLSDLPPYYLFYLLHSVLSSTFPKILSPSPQTSDSSSSKGPLLLPEASPKCSVPI